MAFFSRPWHYVFKLSWCFIIHGNPIEEQNRRQQNSIETFSRRAFNIMTFRPGHHGYSNDVKTTKLNRTLNMMLLFFQTWTSVLNLFQCHGNPTEQNIIKQNKTFIIIMAFFLNLGIAVLHFYNIPMSLKFNRIKQNIKLLIFYRPGHHF